MNRILSLISILFILISADSLFAQATGVGAGVIVGAPTGISGKFWTSRTNAIDVAIGWSNGGEFVRLYNGYFYSQSFIHLHADYLWHDFSVIRTTTRLPLYYGIGVHFDEATAVPTAFGVRGVLGLDWMPYTAPIDVFLEFAPVVFLAPTSGLGLDAGFGVRVFFR